MSIIEKINFAIMCLFFLCYSYQFFYIPVSLIGRHRPHKESRYHRYAVLIAARNERSVIGGLIDNLRAQDYPAELLDIYVVADNCTDDTADIAQAHGARVYCRRDTRRVGKGYALNFLLNAIAQSGRSYDGYFVLDADNVVAENYITEMNKSFSDGHEIVTSYRNSKNYGDNWISAGYALWFLREAKYLNNARMLLGRSCAVSGTGFMFSQRVIERCGGWHFFLLTEDIEFTIDNVVRGQKIAYCPSAVVYDEQPVSFRQSYRQRLRWSRGYIQVFARYGGELMRGIFLRRSASCYDMAMNIMPAAVLSFASVVFNITAAFVSFRTGRDLTALALSIAQTVFNLYLTLFLLGALTTLTEWRQIYCPAHKKLLYTFTFPLFMFTYLPICVISLFKNVQWQPIEHRRCMNLRQICSSDESERSA